MLPPSLPSKSKPLAIPTSSAPKMPLESARLTSPLPSAWVKVHHSEMLRRTRPFHAGPSCESIFHQADRSHHCCFNSSDVSTGPQARTSLLATANEACRMWSSHTGLTSSHTAFQWCCDPVRLTAEKKECEHSWRPSKEISSKLVRKLGLMMILPHRHGCMSRKCQPHGLISRISQGRLLLYFTIYLPLQLHLTLSPDHRAY